MKIMFHMRPDFIQGGITEDAFSIFHSLLNIKGVEVSVIIIDSDYKPFIVIEDKEASQAKRVGYTRIKIRAISQVKHLAKVLARCVVPKPYRKPIKKKICFFMPFLKEFAQDHKMEYPVLSISKEEWKAYLKRFDTRVDDKHLTKLLDVPAFQAARHVIGRDLPVGMRDGDYLFLPFFIDPSVFNQENTYLMRFHDLSFVREASHQGEGAIRLKNELDGALAYENVIFLCDSPYSKEELIAYAPEVNHRAYVLPCQVPQYECKPMDKSSLLEKLPQYLSSRHLRGPNKKKVCESIRGIGKYLLVVGGEHARKNYETLLEGWQAYCKETSEIIPIIWVGYACGEYTGSFIDDAYSLINKGEIIHLEKVSREVLNQLYLHADVLVVASHDEGFSMPPVEANQFQCPVIASDITVHRWVLGEAALFFNPNSADELCKALVKVLVNGESLKESLVKLGVENAKRFYKNNVQSQLENVLQEIDVKKSVSNCAV